MVYKNSSQTTCDQSMANAILHGRIKPHLRRILEAHWNNISGEQQEQKYIDTLFMFNNIPQCHSWGRKNINKNEEKKQLYMNKS